MKKTTFLLSDEATKAIRQMGDRKLRGRIWRECQNGKEYLRFEPYCQRNKKGTHIVINIVVVGAGNMSFEHINPNEDGKI